MSIEIIEPAHNTRMILRKFLVNSMLVDPNKYEDRYEMYEGTCFVLAVDSEWTHETKRLVVESSDDNKNVVSDFLFRKIWNAIGLGMLAERETIKNNKRFYELNDKEKFELYSRIYNSDDCLFYAFDKQSDKYDSFLKQMSYTVAECVNDALKNTENFLIDRDEQRAFFEAFFDAGMNMEARKQMAVPKRLYTSSSSAFPLIKCPDCGKDISKNAKVCPNCGCPIAEEPKKKKSKKWVLVVLLVLFILGALAALFLWNNPEMLWLKNADNSVVTVTCYDKDKEIIGSGSGVVFEENNLIVTNFHVIEDSYSAEITDNNGRSYWVDYVGAYSKEDDLALLVIKGGTIDYIARVGDSSKVKKGDKVYAIGSPMGVSNTVSEGLLSQIVDGYLQISAPISHGSSGGGLFDRWGNLVGITFAGYDDAQNLNYAIPIEAVTRLYNSISSQEPVSLEKIAKTGLAGEDNSDESYDAYLEIIDNIESQYGEIVNTTQLEMYEYADELVGRAVAFDSYVASKQVVKSSNNKYKMVSYILSDSVDYLDLPFYPYSAYDFENYGMIFAYQLYDNYAEVYDVGDEITVMGIFLKDVNGYWVSPVIILSADTEHNCHSRFTEQNSKLSYEEMKALCGVF